MSGYRFLVTGAHDIYFFVSLSGYARNRVALTERVAASARLVLGGRVSRAGEGSRVSGVVDGTSKVGLDKRRVVS